MNDKESFDGIKLMAGNKTTGLFYSKQVINPVTPFNSIDMTSVKYPIAVICCFVWIGFVCAISFMEAWIKFRAPGVSLPVGLSIGRLVFAALNKVEWVLALAIAANLVLERKAKFNLHSLLLIIPVVLLVVQTGWLLPVLDKRAELYIQAHHVQPAPYHFYYVALEVTKVLCLVIFGIGLFKPQKKQVTPY